MAATARPSLGGDWLQGDDASALARPLLDGAWEQAAAVGGGGTVPTITALSAENILATSADYRVTLDFA